MNSSIQQLREILEGVLTCGTSPPDVKNICKGLQEASLLTKRLIREKEETEAPTKKVSSYRQLRICFDPVIAFLRENFEQGSHYSETASENMYSIYCVKADGHKCCLYLSKFLAVEFSSVNPKLVGSKSFASYEDFRTTTVLEKTREVYHHHKKTEWSVELTNAFAKGSLVRLGDVDCPPFPFQMCSTSENQPKEISEDATNSKEMSEVRDINFSDWMEATFQRTNDASDIVPLSKIASKWSFETTSKKNHIESFRKSVIVEKLLFSETWCPFYEEHYLERFEKGGEIFLNVLTNLRLKKEEPKKVSFSIFSKRAASESEERSPPKRMPVKGIDFECEL
jgi:hypothetical protein